jgi:hypothetical protein
MAVTDLTDGLPWWARQGAGPTAGPAAAPQGAGGPPGAGNSASWLQYLSQMFGISPAQAATLSQNGGPNPANMPSPDASNMALQIIDNTADHGTGDNPPVSPFVVPPAPPQANPPAPAGPPAPSPAPSMPARPAGVSASGLPLQPGALSPGALSQFASAAGGPIGSGGYVPWPSGGGSMSPTAPPPAGQTAPGGPLATGGAGGQGATSNPRFGTFQYQDPNSVGNRAPIYTALNLGGLFGGGQPAVNPNAPAPNARPMSGRIAGPLAASTTGKAPWTYGPQQRNIGWPSNTPYGPDWRDLAASRSGYQ